jgi:hypothetical protein
LECGLKVVVGAPFFRGAIGAALEYAFEQYGIVAFQVQSEFGSAAERDEIVGVFQRTGKAVQ